MRLGQVARLLSDAHLQHARMESREVWGLTPRSGLAQPGDLYCLFPEERDRDPQLAFTAAGLGVVAVVCEPGSALPPGLPAVEVPDVGRAYAEASSLFFNHPSHQLKVIGVLESIRETIPNRHRKNSVNVAWLTTQLLNQVGRSTALLGTLGCEFQGHRTESPVSALDAFELQQLLNQQLNDGATTCILELSSVAPETSAAVRLAHTVVADDRRHGVKASCWWNGSVIDLLDQRLLCPLVGPSNVGALAKAVATVILAGVDPRALLPVISTVKPCPGFLQPVRAGQPFAVLIDFADSNEDLDHIIQEARMITTRRVILVCNQFPAQRTGAAFPMPTPVEQADNVFMVAGFPGRRSNLSEMPSANSTGTTNVLLVEKRQVAIQKALQIAAPGDVVLISGSVDPLPGTRAERLGILSDQAIALSALQERGFHP